MLVYCVAVKYLRLGAESQSSMLAAWVGDTLAVLCYGTLAVSCYDSGIIL